MLFRALLIWLLVLAVPAQGAAAATMAFCGPNHHGDAAVTYLHSTTAASIGHHDSPAASHHEKIKATAQEDEDSHASSSSVAAAKIDPASKHKCSACASCCSIGAILNSVLAVPSPFFTPTVFSDLVPSVEALASEGPDRPPRFVFA